MFKVCCALAALLTVSLIPCAYSQDGFASVAVSAPNIGGTEAPKTIYTASIYSAISAPLQAEDKGEESERYFAPTDFALDSQGANFYVASEGFSQLRRIAADGSKTPEILQLSFKPFKLKLFPDETRVAVVGGIGEGRVAIVKIAEKQDDGAASLVPMTLLAEYDCGHSPVDVDVKSDESGDKLYIADRFNNRLLEMNAASGETSREWNVEREPFCLQLTPDGSKVVVADRITNMKANVASSYAKIFVVDLTTGERTEIETPNGTSDLQDLVISPDGRYAFVTGVLSAYLLVTGQIVGGWVAENCVFCVDLQRNKLVEHFFLDDPDLGAANPWGIAISDDGERLVVASSGTDEIIYLPLKRVLSMLSMRPDWARPGYGAFAYNSSKDYANDIPMRIRVKFGLKGLRQVVARGNDAYALSYFEDSICKASLKLTPPFAGEHTGSTIDEVPPRAASSLAAAQGAEPVDDSQQEADAYLASCVDGAAPLRFTELAPCNPSQGVVVERSFARLAPKPELTLRRKGEIVFHDGTACLEHWLSCVTCHPDARSDGFNWDLLNDGSGNFKNTKSMLLSHETPPCMITGIRPDAETAVRAGFTHILFRKSDEESACAVDEYLSTLKPVPSPRLVHGELSESAKRGKILFESDKIDCARCHLGEYFTDLRLHRTGSQDPNDVYEKFDTPTLIEVWRTAPYMNTGAYTTMRELLEEGRHGVKDGRFDALSEEEKNDLIEYVLSL